jgi:ribosomal protein L37AE/L43A
MTKPLARGQVDLSGLTIGRFTVIGYLGKFGGEGKWLVRCACSSYERRSARAIRNPSNGDDACRACRHTAHLKRTNSGITRASPAPSVRP